MPRGRILRCAGRRVGAGAAARKWTARGLLLVRKAACKGSSRAVTAGVWHSPCSPLLLPPADLLCLGSAGCGARGGKQRAACLRAKELGMDAGWLPGGAAGVWGGGDATRPAYTCPGCSWQRSSPWCWCLGWLLLPCSALASFSSHLAGRAGSSLFPSACQSQQSVLRGLRGSPSSCWAAVWSGDQQGCVLPTLAGQEGGSRPCLWASASAFELPPSLCLRGGMWS